MYMNGRRGESGSILLHHQQLHSPSVDAVAQTIDGRQTIHPSARVARILDEALAGDGYNFSVSDRPPTMNAAEKVSDQQRRELIRVLQCEDVRRLRQILRTHEEDSPLLTSPLDSSGNHALHLAVLSGFEEGLELLLGHSSTNVNVRSQWEETALHLAVENEFNTMVQGLLATGKCNLDLQTKRRGETVLHAAARVGNVFATKELLSRNFNFHTMDVDGNTALHLAVLKKRVEITRQLLLAGLDPRAKNYQQKTPMFIAMRELNDQRITEILVRVKRPGRRAHDPPPLRPQKRDGPAGRPKPRAAAPQGSKEKGPIFTTEVPPEMIKERKFNDATPTVEDEEEKVEGEKAVQHAQRTLKSAGVQASPDESDEKVERPIVVRKHSSDFYKMDSRPLGLCVIFNNETYWHDKFEERTGANIDENRLNSVFRRLNYRVRIHKNLNAAEMFWEVMSIARHTDHSPYDSFVCCILSHGSLGTIYGVDGDSFRISELTIALTSRRCPSLAGKPKMFFIQACRGDDHQSMLDDQNTHDAQINGSESAKLTPDHADFLLSYATVAGYRAHRHKQNGSLYVQNLCNYLHALHKEQDLLSILTKVNAETCAKVFEAPDGSKFVQMPEVRHTLTKAIIFR